MQFFARINNGIVAEIVELPDGLAIGQCYHADLTFVGCDSTVQVGYTYDGKAFAAPPPPPPPTLPQQAQAAMSAGIQIVSTGTPALNGTYPIDSVSQQEMQTYVQAIALGLETGPILWNDMQGAVHGFTTAQFQALVAVAYPYTKGVIQVIKGQSSTLPSQPGPIA